MGYLDKLSELTILEKCKICNCPDCVSFSGISRLDIPPIRGVDGPQGVRLENGKTATALPCNMALAAAFAPETAFEYGEIIAKDCIANDYQIIYGPGINLMRTPLNGRNFEYMGEDPVVAGRIGAAYVRGCQSHAVAACPKHLALNNQEICRIIGSSNCDWETIRNLYLEAFRIIVKEASPWCIMSSYNKINGTFASQCGILQQQILKDEWGFDGVVISDAGAVHDGQAAFCNGLDAELAGLEFEHLAELVENGILPEKQLDEKARRMLRLNERVSAARSMPSDPQAHSAFARRCAAESIVLLKNREKILPLDMSKNKRILITGPAADAFHCIGAMEKMGGSGAVHPPYEITPLAGLQAVEEGFEFTYMPSLRSCQEQYLAPEVLEKLHIRYFDFDNGELFFEEDLNSASFCFGPVNAAGVSKDHPAEGRKFRAEIIGRIKAPHRMQGRFMIFDTRLHAKLRYNDHEVEFNSNYIPQTELAAGEKLDFTVSFENRSARYAELNLLWDEDDSRQISRVLQCAPDYDAVIYFGGRTHMQDKEALGIGDVPIADIDTWELPGRQDEFLTQLCAANRRVIGVFNTGSSFDMRSWHEEIAAILISWYPGMEGGNAIADILTGKAEPGGRLPFTWGADIMDYACHANGSYPGTRTGDDPHTDYLEGELIGYRYFDRMNKVPLYPFGGGTGYTEFLIGEAEISRTDGIRISISVKNNGQRTGSEVMHLYAGGRLEPRTRPLKELISFSKISAAPGETVQVEFYLSTAEIEKLLQNSFQELLIGKNAVDLPLAFPLKNK